MLLRSNLTPGEAAQRCKARKKWRPYTYLNGVSVGSGRATRPKHVTCWGVSMWDPAHAIVAWQTCASPGQGSEPSIVRQVYLENPKPEEGAEDDPAIMTSHIIRAPPVLCAQVGTADGASVHVGIC